MSRLTLPLRTYSHLAAARRLPSEYEIVTSRVLYYVDRGFEVDVPVAPWYQRYQTGSPFRCRDWDAFSDPRQTTYTRYTALQAQKEIHVSALFAGVETAGSPPTAPAWDDLLVRVIGPARFLVHGLQMIAAYVASMAPGGRIVIASMFQAADEARRIFHLAQRLALLRMDKIEISQRSRVAWQQARQWQPLRRMLERALVTYDWGEAFVVLNLGLKPVIDALLLTELARTARDHGDHVFAGVLASLGEDAVWHRDWAAALLGVAFTDDAENRKVVRRWLDKWSADIAGAVAALVVPVWGPNESTGAAVLDRAVGSANKWLASLELGGT